LFVPGERGVDGTPSGMRQVGTETIVSPVFSWTALYISKVRGTNFANESLGGIDQGKSLFDVFIAQTVPERRDYYSPRSEETGSLWDHYLLVIEPASAP